VEALSLAHDRFSLHGDQRFEVLLDFRVKCLLEIHAWCRKFPRVAGGDTKEVQVAHAAR
jgi:hypothetical protein